MVRWHPRVLVDLVFAAVVAVLSVADLATSSSSRLPGERPADALAYTLVVIGSAGLVGRRRSPVAVLALVTVVLVTVYLRDYGAYLSVLGLSALYAVAAHGEHRRGAWWALGLASVAMLAAASVSLLDRPEGFSYLTGLTMVAFMAGAIAAGVVVRNRERIFVDAERRAAAAKAADVFAQIEAVGRESLMELRRMLGVLRDQGDGDASLAPQPGLADLATAVQESTLAGVPTELVVEGDPTPVAPGVQLAAYRIVQEALTNVRKHAGHAATARVRLGYQPTALVVEVTDDGRGAATALAGTGAGHGLIGMRERVDVYGGQLVTGPRPGGGFVVRATLPQGEPA